MTQEPLVITEMHIKIRMDAGQEQGENQAVWKSSSEKANEDKWSLVGSQK